MSTRSPCCSSHSVQGEASPGERCRAVDPSLDPRTRPRITNRHATGTAAERTRYPHATMCGMGVDEPVRERLVSAGVGLLEEVGAAQLALRAIAREAGVSHGAPRRYFPTHNALLA